MHTTELTAIKDNPMIGAEYVGYYLLFGKDGIRVHLIKKPTFLKRFWWNVFFEVTWTDL